MKKYKSIIIFYFVVLFCEIIADLFQLRILTILLKTLLMPLLGYIVFQHSLHKNKLLFAALFFSWFGDIFLLFKPEMYFMLGLGSFFIAQICYVFLFSQKATTNWFVRLAFVLPISLLFWFVIQPNLPTALLYPVLAYLVVLVSMGIRANEVTPYSLSLGLGGILFVISDTFIALNKFVLPLPASTFLVMSTYGIAQFLLVKGWLSRK